MDLGDDDDNYYNVSHKTREDTQKTHEEGDELFTQGLYHRSVEYYKIVCGSGAFEAGSVECVGGCPLLHPSHPPNR